MANTKNARKILGALGLPPAQQNEISSLTLLALCGLGRRDSWTRATRSSLTISKGIMKFIQERHGRRYAPNTRETFRRQVLHQFIQAHLVDYNPDEPDLPTNSPRAHYAISDAALEAIRSFGTRNWENAAESFTKSKGALVEIYRKRRKGRMTPVHLPDGRSLALSPGKHNVVQAAVIEQFAPRFVPGAEVLYLGDTEKKHLFIDSDKLRELGIPITEHDKLPDVVLFQKDKNRVFLVEAVTSHGPMTPKRVEELCRMLAASSTRAVFVSAFPDFAEFRRHIRSIAWETEVWIAEIPDHLIHFNGERFLGPY